MGDYHGPDNHWFYELSQSNIFAPLESLSAKVCRRSMPVAVRSGRGVQVCFSPQ